MSIKRTAIYFCTALALAGCSTGTYLKPYAPIGWYSTENPACPGAQEVLEFSLPNYDWLVFRILAKQPTEYHPEGTKLIAYVRPIFYKHPEPDGSWSLFPSERERNMEESLISERKSQHIEILFSAPSAVVTFSDGSETQVELPFFQRPFKLPSEKYYGIEGPEALISKNKLESFTVKLPTLYVNGEIFSIPPIEFKVSEGKYAPVLNC